jgi:hypothetical protein
MLSLLLLLMMEREEDEADETVRRKLRRWIDTEERVFKVDELGVEGEIRDGTVLEAGGDVHSLERPARW